MFCLTFLLKYLNFCCLSFEIQYVEAWNIIVFHFCADRAGFWPSAALRHIITENASHHVKRNPAQHRTHASAWEIWIFEIEKSMNPKVFGSFSSKSRFPKFDISQLFSSFKYVLALILSSEIILECIVIDSMRKSENSFLAARRRLYVEVLFAGGNLKIDRIWS